ncbi:COG4315 family predicted lipoprotein [Spirillospora sp. CA-253888]
MRKRLVAGTIVLVMAAAGCSGDPDQEDMATPGKTLPVFQGGRALVQVGTTGQGPALVDGLGRALYLFEREGEGRPRCADDCQDMWPPYLTEGPPKAGAGARQDLLGSVERADGKEQVTYAGQPLYRYRKDLAPTDSAGHDLWDHGAEWYLVTATGARVPS